MPHTNLFDKFCSRHLRLMYSQNVTSGVQTINHKQYIVSTPLWKTVAPLVIEMVSWVCLPLFILFYLWIRYLHYLLLLKLWSPPISVVRLHAWSQSWRKHVHTVLQQEQKHSRRITSYVHNAQDNKMSLSLSVSLQLYLLATPSSANSLYFALKPGFH